MHNVAFHKQNTLPDLTSLDSPVIPLPRKIGPYKIESLLNRGGMSYLYLGIHPNTSQPMAVKVLSPKYLTNKEMTSRFLKEAQIIGITNHPNIVKLYNQGSWEKGLYIAMEFIQGISLRQFILQKSLSHRRALEIILQVAYALCHLHTHGVIHRDLKPENILITESGGIKVIDFGIAQLQGEADPTFYTKDRRVIGTPAYMSPEQKENPLSVSYSSDIYSLGVIAYELVLGRLSYGIIHLSFLPNPLRPLIEKALKFHESERYQDIVDFITDIAHYLKSLEDNPQQPSEDILDMVQQTRSILVSQKPPRWPQVEIGIALPEGIPLSGFYFDYFRLPENQLCLIFAEPLELGISSLLYASILRGMVRMAVQQSFYNGKKDLHPIKMLSGLNRALYEDPMHQTFRLCLLLLNPEKDLLSFVSCHYASLWHIPEGSKKIRSLSTPNPQLGSNPNVTLLETADNWHSGDTLLLCPSQALEESLVELDAEDLLLSAQHQAERLLGRYSPAKRPSAILSIHRVF